MWYRRAMARILFSISCFHPPQTAHASEGPRSALFLSWQWLHAVRELGLFSSSPLVSFPALWDCSNFFIPNEHVSNGEVSYFSFVFLFFFWLLPEGPKKGSCLFLEFFTLVWKSCSKIRCSALFCGLVTVTQHVRRL